MSVVKYGIVIERGLHNYSAYVPDLPGCIATGATLDKTKVRLRAAIEAHLNGLREAGEPIPAPSVICDWVEVA